MIIKTHKPKETEKTLSKVLNLLYHLEDLTSYENKTIGNFINKIQSSKVVLK